MHRKPGRGRESSVRRSAGRAERDRRRRGRGEKRDTRHRTRDTGRVPDTYGTTRPRRPTRSSKASRDMWPPNAPTNMSPSARRNRSTAADSVTALTSSTYACAFVRARAGACKVGTNTGPHKHNARVTVTCCVSTLQGASMVQCTSMVTCCLLPLCHGLCRVPPLSLCASTVVCRHCPSLPRGFLSPSLPRSTLPTHSQTARGPRRVVAVGNYPHASELTRVNYTQGRGAQGQ